MQPSDGNAETLLDEDVVQDRLEEGVPLLPKKAHSTPPSKSFAQHRSHIREHGIRHYCSTQFCGKASETVSKSHNGKLLLYDHDSLLTARSILNIGLSAFTQGPVLSTLAYCLTVCLISAAAVFFMPKSSKLDTSKFLEFGLFLKLFIAFMLGTYVTQAFGRWWYSVTTFEKFLNSIQQMLFMLHTIRGRPDWRNMVEKYCVCSGYILTAEVRNVHHNVCEKTRVDMNQLLDWLVVNNYLSEEECALLKAKPNGVLVKTRTIWSWIGELVSHPVLEEGVVVAPPLLVRTIVLCQSCINEMEHLKMNVTVQMPFMYAQLLAILVHVNNTILALTCGLSLGSSMNEIRRRSEQLSGDRDMEHSENASLEQLYGAFQSVGIQLITVLLIPMCYVAFLHIAHMLCYPFGDEVYHLPTETSIAKLHIDLNMMTENRDYFRRKHEEWKAMEHKKKHTRKDEDEEDEDEGDEDCDDG